VKLLALIVVLFVVAGCSSVTPIPEQARVIDYGGGCNVTVYQTEAEAEEDGEIKELCVIEGTSSGSFKHTTETAIKKHAKKACECGSNKVYVQSRAPMDWGVAKVSMIAFKYVEAKQEKESDTPSYIDELKALAALKDEGIITEEEFQKQKAEILDEN